MSQLGTAVPATPPQIRQYRTALLLRLMVLVPFVEGAKSGPLSIGRVFAAVAITALAARLVLTRWRPHRLPAPAWLPPILFATWAMASGFWATHAASWLFALGQIGLAIAYFAVFAFLVTDPAQVRPLLQTYTLAAIAVAMVGIFQITGGVRAAGLQGDPNLYALYQVAAIPAAFGLSRGAGPVARKWWLVAVLPLLASVLAAQSRGAVVAAAVVFAYLGVREGLRGDGGRVSGRLLPSLLAALLVVSGLVWAATSLSDRFNPQRVEADRASGRLDLWYVAWRAHEQHPVLGLGAGNFKPESVDLLTREPGVELIQSHLLDSSGIEVHNVYLEALSELGPLGAALFVGTLLVTLAGLGAAARASPSRPEIAALVPMLLAYLAGATFLSIVNSKLLWLLVGVNAALWATRPVRVRTAPDESVWRIK